MADIGELMKLRAGLSLSGGTPALNSIVLSSSAIRVGGGTTAGGSLDAGTTPVISWTSTAVTLAQATTITTNTVINADGLRYAGANRAAMGVGVRFNASNCPLLLAYQNNNGAPYLGWNTVQTASSDNQTYDISSVTAAKIVSGTNPLYVYVAAAGTAGNTITWVEAVTTTAAGAWTFADSITAGPASGASNTAHTLRSGQQVSLTLQSSGTNSDCQLIGKPVGTGAFYIGNGTAQKSIVIATTTTNPLDTEIARATYVGAFTIGPTAGFSVSGQGHLVYGNQNADTSVLDLRKPTGGDTNSNYYVQCRAGATGTTEQGGLWNDGSGNFATYTLSDISLKENIRKSPVGIQQILALKPSRYDWKSRASVDNDGFIAQDFEKVFPRSVGTSQDGTKHISVGLEFFAAMVNSIQELKAEIDALKAR